MTRAASRSFSQTTVSIPPTCASSQAPRIEAERGHHADLDELAGYLRGELAVVEFPEIQHGDGDDLEVFAAERPGDEVRVVVQLLDGLEHPLLDVGADGRIVAQDLARGVHGDSSPLGYLSQCHVVFRPPEVLTMLNFVT